MAAPHGRRSRSQIRALVGREPVGVDQMRRRDAGLSLVKDFVVWQCNRQAARPLQAARALGTFWGIELDRQAESQGFQDSSSGLAEGGGAGGVLCKIDSW